MTDAQPQQLKSGAWQFPCAAHGALVTASLKAAGWKTSASCKICDRAALQPTLDAIRAAQSNGHSETRAVAEEKTQRREAPREHGTPHDRDSQSASQQAGASPARPTNAQSVKQIAGPDDFLRRVPPNDAEAEMGVLGAVLIENETIGQIPWLAVDMFYRESHRHIYRAMVTLRENAKPIDAVTLSRALKTADKFEQIGGASYIAEIVEAVPTSRNIEHYAAIVRDMSIKREVATRATALVSLAYNGVSADALIGEMERTLRFDTAGGLPSLISNKIEVMSGLEFHQQQQALPPRSWLVDGLLAKQEISLWSGKVEAGKTTAMRTLVMCIMRGEPFLERATYPSRVFYVMLDADGTGMTYRGFTDLGWNPEQDPMDVLIDPVMAIRPNSFEQFHQELLERKPALVIVDPLGRFQKIDDINDYGTTYAMARFSELAKRCDCHIALLHHIPRGRSDDADPATAGFGSIAIAGDATPDLRS